MNVHDTPIQSFYFVQRKIEKVTINLHSQHSSHMFKWHDCQHMVFVSAGTPCGNDRWCIETRCVAKSENTTDIYQGPNTCDLELPDRGDCDYGYLECSDGGSTM